MTPKNRREVTDQTRTKKAVHATIAEKPWLGWQAERKRLSEANGNEYSLTDAIAHYGQLFSNPRWREVIWEEENLKRQPPQSARPGLRVAAG